MKKEDFVSIMITFVVGFFIGGYLYTTNTARWVAEVETPDIEELSEFTIVGDVYGGCRSACPSFQLLGDGSYRYLFTPAAGADQVLRQGALPIQMRRNLRKVLTDEALLVQSKSIEPLICNSYTDGIDVKYEITIDSKDYVIDSCGTNVQSESALWVTLGEVWDYFEQTGNKE
jgi:hypothetical protein